MQWIVLGLVSQHIVGDFGFLALFSQQLTRASRRLSVAMSSHRVGFTSS
jgi:hypothetical protein